MLQIFGGVCTIAAYSSTDQLALRTLFAAGTITGGIIPNLYRKPRLVLPLFWSSMFLSINGTRIYNLVIERKPVSFDEELLKIYESTFYGYLTPNQFDKMMGHGHIVTYEKDSELKKEGDNAKDLMLVLDGCIELRSVGSMVSKIDTKDGQFKFVGIPRKLTSDEDDVEKDDDANADHTTDNKMVQLISARQSKILVFNLAELKSLLGNEPALSNGLLQLFHERLLQKVLIRDKSLAVKRYFAMIELAIKEAAVEGIGLSPEVKRGLKKFRREHHISKVKARVEKRPINDSSVAIYVHSGSLGPFAQ